MSFVLVVSRGALAITSPAVMLSPSFTVMIEPCDR
jgi:hypothetical protein